MFNAAHPSESALAKREEIGIFVPERRILLVVFCMATGIVTVYLSQDWLFIGNSVRPLAVGGVGLFAAAGRALVARRLGSGFAASIMRYGAVFFLGWVSAAWQLHQHPVSNLGAHIEVVQSESARHRRTAIKEQLSGQIIAIDGQVERRTSQFCSQFFTAALSLYERGADPGCVPVCGAKPFDLD